MDASGNRLLLEWVFFLFGYIDPHLHFTEEKPEGVPSQLKTTMLVLAVTLHNIPKDGSQVMAVGVTLRE